MADGPPVVPGSTSLADYISGLWGAVGVMMALREAERTGQGQEIDVPLYAAVFRLLDELVPAYAKFGEIRHRWGADVPHVVPHGHWQTADNKWVALACSSDKIFARLVKEMGRPDLAASDRFETNAQRLVKRKEINQLISDWIGSLTLAEILTHCDAAGVPCGPIMTVADIFADPHYAYREDYQSIDDPRVGALVVPAALPRLSGQTPTLKHLGGALGADTVDILQSLLELSQTEIDKLTQAGAI